MLAASVKQKSAFAPVARPGVPGAPEFGCSTPPHGNITMSGLQGGWTHPFYSVRIFSLSFKLYLMYLVTMKLLHILNPINPCFILVIFSYRLVQYKVLSVTSRINCIVARCLINVVYLTVCSLYQVIMRLHFLNDVANDAESTQKSKITS